MPASELERAGRCGRFRLAPPRAVADSTDVVTGCETVSLPDPPAGNDPTPPTQTTPTTPNPTDPAPTDPTPPTTTRTAGVPSVRSTRVRINRRRTGSFVVRCVGQTTCSGTLKVTTRIRGRRYTFASKRYVVRAGRTGTVVVPFTRFAVSTIRATRRDQLRVTVTLTRTKGAPIQRVVTILA